MFSLSSSVEPSSSNANPTFKRSAHLGVHRTILNLFHTKTEDKASGVSSVNLPTSDTPLNPISTERAHDICLVSDSPHYIVRVSLHVCPSFSILTSAHRSPRSRVQATSTSSTDSFATIPPSSQSPILLDSVLLTMLLPATKWPFWRSSCSLTEVHPSSIHPHSD